MYKVDSCKILKTSELFTFGKVHIKFPEEQNEIGNAVREGVQRIKLFRRNFPMSLDSSPPFSVHDSQHF